jgi:GNAT superfamily N-acetyltransferase
LQRSALKTSSNTPSGSKPEITAEFSRGIAFTDADGAARTLGLWHLLRAGMAAWPLRWGLRSALRALAMLSRQQSAAPPAASPADAELLMVTVAPGMQRRGAGSALLRELLSRWDVASLRSGDVGKGGCGGAVVLGTHQERSLPFYERAGFAVTARVAMVNASSKDGEDASCCWVMQRDCQAAAPEGRAMQLHEATVQCSACVLTLSPSLSHTAGSHSW